jgi:hypothetical protein
MRLLNVDTLKLETFYEPHVPRYAALSHTWGKEEVLFQDIEAGQRDRKNWTKIYRSASTAQVLGWKYIWIDTCCIDKTSSAELSEAINSMYRWYLKCDVCIAYLEDVSLESDLNEVDHNAHIATHLLLYPTFSQARWFKRGWTLQELIAPHNLCFYDSDWTKIGEKQELLEDIQQITGIDSDILRDQRLLHHQSIAHKMSWASRRETTRVEDIAYCLMGIFKINMPLLYGESQRAFARLQEEIMKRTYDHSLFAWNQKFHLPQAYWTAFRNVARSPEGVGVLALNPSAFDRSAGIIPRSSKSAPYATTNRGLQICLRVVPHTSPNLSHTHVGLLECHRTTSTIGIPLARQGAFSQDNISANRRPTDAYYRTANEDLLYFPNSLLAAAEARLVHLHELGLYWEIG